MVRLYASGVGWRAMKLGMNMLLWSTDVSGSEFDPTFALLKDMGFAGVEIPIFDREVDKYAELGLRLEELGLERLAVSPPGGHHNPTSPHPPLPPPPPPPPTPHT